MIFFIVTACIYNACPIRKSQYVFGITRLKETVVKLNIKDYKIIVVENNGPRNTFLNASPLSDNCEIFYTHNNFLNTPNKGIKELKDVVDCINEYNIKDADFIVKLTGRYILNDSSEFMNTVKDIYETRVDEPACKYKYDCIIKYGSYLKPVDYITDDCITGLIGMAGFYVKQIKFPDNRGCVEWSWAKATRLINPEKIYLVDTLGIQICPGSNKYFGV